MSFETSSATDATLAPDLRPDGSLVDCREKLRQLRENHGELDQVLKDCFDDAILMGVDAAAMRHLLHGMVDSLRDPRSRGSEP